MNLISVGSFAEISFHVVLGGNLASKLGKTSLGFRSNGAGLIINRPANSDLDLWLMVVF